MKGSIIFTGLCLLTLGSILFWARITSHDHSTSVTVTETAETYSFSAQYDRRETGRVERFINREISPDQMGSSENDYVDATTSLADHTTFNIKESPGRLKIEIDKTQNPAASVSRIRKLCDGVKDLLSNR
jgi:hypothetical protein